MDHLIEQSVQAYEISADWGEFIIKFRKEGDLRRDVKHQLHHA
jgi:hypothetical protein